MNKKYCVIGNPISHSISPKLHNYAYEKLNIDANYSKVLLENKADLKKTILEYQYDGANITVPFKEAAYDICDEVVGIAQKIKAVNTIVRKHDKLIGFNTDATGFLKSIERFRGINSILILGAGGTAKAISHILRENNLHVHILNRSKNRLESFRDNGFKTFTHDDNLPNNYDLIVNTTSAGLNNNELPAPKELLLHISKNCRFAYDVIYNKHTPFLEFCKEQNLICKDGADMLLYQAVFAFKIFFDNIYNEVDIIRYMREALHA